MKWTILFLTFTLNLWCQEFDIQGHRGCRGLYPENSIEGMIHAVNLGVTTLEMDVVISKDKQVILSHEPFLAHEICLDYNDNPIFKSNEKAFNLYKMDYNEIKECDCSTIIHKRFLNQKKFKSYKPLLSEVIDTVEKHVKKFYPDRIVYYNIETKSSTEGDEKFHPKPKEFVDLILKVIDKKKIESKVFIQSFDIRTLQYLKTIQPDFKTVLLVENKFSVKDNIKKLGFSPTVYSPEFILLKKQDVDYLHSQKIKVIPWTINEVISMKKMIDMGIDGIITDYPNLFFEHKKLLTLQKKP